MSQDKDPNKSVNPVYLRIDEIEETPVEKGRLLYSNLKEVSVNNRTYFEGIEPLPENRNFGVRFRGEQEYVNMKTHPNLYGAHTLVGTGTNILNSLVKYLSHGENKVVMDMTDDGIDFHNRNMAQAAMKTYTYMGGNGEFLSLNISTHKKKVDVESIQTGNVDPKTKSVTVTTNQSLFRKNTIDKLLKSVTPLNQPWDSTEQMINTIGRFPISNNNYRAEIAEQKEKQDKIDSAVPLEAARTKLATSTEVTKDHVSQLFSKMRSDFNNKLESGDLEGLLKLNDMNSITIKEKMIITMEIDPVKYIGYNRESYGTEFGLNLISKYKEGVSKMKADPTILKMEKLPGHLSNYIITREMEVETELDGARIMASATPAMFQRAMVLNELGDLTAKQLEAKLKVLGNPDLKNSKMINLFNISDLYSGKWYATKVTHTINSSGYITECECIKQGIPILSSSTSSNIDLMGWYKKLHNSGIQKAKGGYENRQVSNEAIQTFQDSFADPESGNYLHWQSTVGFIKPQDEKTELQIHNAEQPYYKPGTVTGNVLETAKKIK